MRRLMMAMRKGGRMSAKQDYWVECIANAAEECGLVLTPEQLECLASGAESGHEHYGMAFYSPPASDRIDDIEREWKKKVADLEARLATYRDNAEIAVKQALRLRRDDNVTIGAHGEVLRHDGRTERIQ